MSKIAFKTFKTKSRQFLRKLLHIEYIRLQLSHPDALIYLAIFGLITGLLSGGVIIAFRLLVEQSQALFLMDGSSEHYEGLSIVWRFLLPLFGGILLAFFFKYFAQDFYVTGITKIMERMAYHQGYIRLRGLFVQFFGAAIAIISGHSVGLEGPHAYLGAATGSQVGQLFSLPNNSIRTMAACGTAAGIAASFNTPLAGVIFALEVIMMDYTLASFIPIILAAVSATALSNAILGNQPAFIVPSFQMGSLTDIPNILILSVICGAMGAFFIHLLENITKKMHHIPIYWKVILAGFIMGILGVFCPEVMGVGYDSINKLLLGEYTLGTLFILLIFKLLATSSCLALGIPGGMIAPTFFIGAILGSLAGILSYILIGGQSIMGFYAVIGMGAMFGACFQAPLAALTAIMELTYNPSIIMPSMLAIVGAQLVASEVFHKKSFYLTMLSANGMDYQTSPILQTLRRLGVASVMNTNFVRTSTEINLTLANSFIADKIDWLIIDNEKNEPVQLMPMVELAKYIKTLDLDEAVDIEQDPMLHLIEIPAKRLQIYPISVQASLQEAHMLIEKDHVESFMVVYQRDINDKDYRRIYGILTPRMIEKSYQV